MNIPGAKVINMGPPGSGKTHSIRTLLGNGLEVFGIITEPNAMIVLGDILDQIHYTLIPPAGISWASFINRAQKVLTMDASALTKLTGSRQEYTQFMDILQTCSHFVDQTGFDHGDISTWGTNRVLFLDSLSGLNTMITQMVAGNKMNMTLPEYGIAQKLEIGFLEKILLGCRCHFILNTHVEMNKDEVLGGMKLLITSIGNKLAPVLPVNFNDCFLSYTEGDKFLWRTTSALADLKTNNLPRGEGIQQDYTLLLNNWQRKGGVIEP